MSLLTNPPSWSPNQYIPSSSSPKHRYPLLESVKVLLRRKLGNQLSWRGPFSAKCSRLERPSTCLSTARAAPEVPHAAQTQALATHKQHPSCTPFGTGSKKPNVTLQGLLDLKQVRHRGCQGFSAKGTLGRANEVGARDSACTYLMV